MLKILSAQQIKALDAYTIEQAAIESIDLMERACRTFLNWYVEKFDERLRTGIVCGTGNNGGDGLGVARMLIERGYPVTVWIVRGDTAPSGDFNINLESAKTSSVRIFEILNKEQTDNFFGEIDVLIDALFGSGLSRPLTGLHQWIIETMNNAPVKRVAIDIPSGLMADKVSIGTVFKADYTISFQLPKLAFFLPQNHPFVGEWCLVDIGLNKNFIRESETKFYYIAGKGPRHVLKQRSKFDHKGTFGHALLMVGSLGKMGAAVLSSRAAVRSGLGLLTVHIPRCGNIIMQTSVPEAMVSLDRNEEMLTSPPSLEHFTTVGVGPGLGTSYDTVKALQYVLEHFRQPMVIDADALNIISENRELLQLIPPGTILTPHPKEFERLAGKSHDDYHRLEKLRSLAMQLQSVVVLKGAFTAIAAPDGSIYFNGTGNPGMATGGTGDVLTGILTGLLAQKYEPLQAAQVGVYLHGLSGDLAVPELGVNSLIASDIIDFLPSAFLKLHP